VSGSCHRGPAAAKGKSRCSGLRWHAGARLMDRVDSPGCRRRRAWKRRLRRGHHPLVRPTRNSRRRRAQKPVMEDARRSFGPGRRRGPLRSSGISGPEAARALGPVAPSTRRVPSTLTFAPSSSVYDRDRSLRTLGLRTCHPGPPMEPRARSTGAPRGAPLTIRWFDWRARSPSDPCETLEGGERR